MKVYLSILFVVTSLISCAQGKQSSPVTKPTFILGLGGYKFDKQDFIPQVSGTIGVKSQAFVFGFGAGWARFKDDPSSYVPVYLELGAIPGGKAAPFLLVRMGKGIYNHSTKIGSITTSTNGGLYYEMRAGISVGDQQVRMLIGAGYVNQQFKYSTTYAGTTTKGLGGLSIFVSARL